MASTEDGWRLDWLSISPDRLWVGERKWVIGCTGLSVVGTFAVVFHMHGFFEVSLTIAGGLTFLLLSIAAIAAMWKSDPWLSRTYDRYRRYPAFIPAHASSAASEISRKIERNRNHFKR